MSFFVAGTGTGVGKTLVTAALVSQLGPPWRARKPLASGAEGMESDPAILARAQNATEADVCLHRFAAPLAPHRAAEAAGVNLDWRDIVRFCEGDRMIIEGAGGLFSPLTSTRNNADLVKELAMPVILVTGCYLGTLTHTIATLRAAEAEGVSVAGLVVSQHAGEPLPDIVAEDLRALQTGLSPIFLLPYLAGANPWRESPDMRQWLGETAASR